MDAQFDERQQLIRMLSHALRHNPDEHFLDMDSEGWAEIDDVLLVVHCHRSRWRFVSRAELVEVATTAFGNRFEIAGDRIRALYGRIVPFVESGNERIPPTVLFHGTSKHAYESIEEHGLKPMARRLVHLTTDQAYELGVGESKKTVDSICLEVAAQAVYRIGQRFWQANNLVWPTAVVSAEFITPFKSRLRV
jgi:putative RNA 2'-phosphotransferase